MKVFLALSTILSLTIAKAVPTQVSYDGAKAVRITVGADIAPVKSLIQGLSLPVWKGAIDGIPKANSHVDVVVPASLLNAFKIATVGLEVVVMHEDLGASIAAELADSKPAVVEKRAGLANSAWFGGYHEYAQHLQFLRDLQATYPHNSEIVVQGNSDGNRPITGIHFWGSGGKGSKPAIVLHGNVHAREWVTGMTTEYLAYNLLSNYGINSEITGFVNKYDYYIFPVVNPDGFVYSQTTDRLWRKNRQTVSTSNCVGRDNNRNWKFQWNVPGGASTDPCDPTFKGLAAGDATENKVLASYIDKLAAGKGVQLFIDLHSYSQLFMTPYGYSCTAVALNNVVIQSLAAGAASAIQGIYGISYKYGPICSTIYQATGNSVDYVNDVSKSKYTFTIELRDTGRYGFVLPAAQILPTATETYAGLRYLLLKM